MPDDSIHSHRRSLLWWTTSQLAIWHLLEGRGFLTHAHQAKVMSSGTAGYDRDKSRRYQRKAPEGANFQPLDPGGFPGLSLLAAGFSRCCLPIQTDDEINLTISLMPMDFLTRSMRLSF